MSSSNTFTKRPVSAAVQAAIYAMALSASVNVQAAPVGGQVVGGTGSISQSGLNTTINQTSQNMAINWQTYNVYQNERVQYIQPNTSSISLNRILSNNGSTIAGRIDANGQVILVNPNGIFFTSTAVVNVGGIIASGLDITPNDFMNGNYIGKVVNTGTINASLGGNVALLGKQVENDGLIAAKLGTVTLAAGKQAVLTFDNGGVLGVRVSKAILQDELGVDPAVINKGGIKAAGGRVLLTASTSQDVFSQAVNSGDIQQATSVVVNADGSFTLGDGADVVNTGSVDTSTTDANQNPGQIVMLGNNVTNSGSLTADAVSGNAGEIELHSTDTTLLTGDSLTSARSEDGGIGGFVKVLGDKVGLFDQSTVDVSGANGGGQALIGGDFHGANANIHNATVTYVDSGVTLSADALFYGNGGNIVNWADGTTSFYGSIFSRGGSFSGNGGSVEVSGKQTLQFHGAVDTSAQNGLTGSLLLDPASITILAGTGDSQTDGTDAFHGCSTSNPGCGTTSSNYGKVLANNGSPSSIYQSELEGISSTTNIILAATGDITVNDLGTNGILSLQTGTGNSVTFTADANNDGVGDFIMNNVANTIQTGGGDINISGANITTGILSTTNAGIAGGAVSVTGTGTVDIASIDTHGGVLSVNGLGNAGGTVSVSGDSITVGAINTSGGDSRGDGRPTDSAGVSGAISLDTTGGTGNIYINGAITANGGNGPTGPNGADGSGGDASLVSILSAGDISVASTGSIFANGGHATTANNAGGNGAHGNGGSSSGITLSAGQDLFVNGALSANGGAGATNSTGDGGTAGAITLTTSRNSTVSANISSNGGLAPNGTAGSNGDININGSSGNNIFTITGDPTLTGAKVQFNGNNGNDTLVHNGASNINNTWTIGQVSSNFDGVNDGALDYNGNRVYFYNIANLTGGNQADTFNIRSDGSITGLIDGGNSGTTAVTDQLNITSNSTSETVVELGARSTYDPTRTSVNNVEQISAGGTSAFRVIGPDAASIWSVDGTTTVNFAPDIATPTSDQLVSLTGFDTIQGGTAQDTFNVTGGYAGILDGGSGTSNILNITSNAVTSVLVTLGNAIPTGSTANVFVNNFQTIDASTNGAANTLAVNGGASWNIDTQDHGTVAGITFTNFTNLIGGAGNNTFDIHAGITSISVNDTSTASTSDASSVHVYSGGSVTGAITGGAGTETFTVDAGGQVNTINTGTGSYADSVILANPGVVTAASSSATPALIGGSGNDSLTVLSTGNTWAFSAADATTGYVLNTTYSANPVYFTGFANPSGGGNDTLDYSAVTGNISLDLNKITGVGTIIGNYGNAAGGTTTITGKDGSTNTWSIGVVTVAGAATDGVNDGTVVYGANSLIFENVTGLIGGASATNKFILTSGGAFDGTLQGGSGNANFLTAQGGIANTWTIDSANGGNLQYTLAAATYTTYFSNIQNLISGGSDTFNLDANLTNATTGSLSGYISGTSADTLNIKTNNNTVQIMALLTDPVVSGRLNENGINNLVSTGTNNTLVSANSSNNAWSISGSNIGTLNAAINFNGFDNLASGGSSDTFTISAAGALNGLLDGTVGTTTVNIATPNAIVNVAANGNTPLTTTNAAGTFTIFGVDTLAASGANATLVSANLPNNSWDISKVNGGTLNANLNFGGFVNLTAGGNSDNFNITTGSLDGLINGSSTASLSLSANNSTIQIAATPATPISANPAGTFTVYGFSNLVATGSNDKLLELSTNGNQWNITGTNRGNIDSTIQFRGFANITGGAGNDTFNYNGGSLSGLIDGGAGTNSFSDNSNSDIKVKLYLSDPGTPITDTTADLHLYQVTALANNGSGLDTLIGPDASNTWKIDNINAGQISATDTGHPLPVSYTFTGFQNLTGGSQDDHFYLTTASANTNSTNYSELVTGLIDGGGQSTQDTLTLYFTNATTRKSTKIKLGSTAGNGIIGDGYINVTGVELLNGYSQNADGTGGSMNANSSNPTLVAADIDNNWDINDVNGGVINNALGSVTYTYFAKVVGGNHDDTFKIASNIGKLNYQIDGGDQISSDNIDYSASTVPVVVTYDPTGLNIAGITNIEGVIGNGTDSTLIGPDSGTTTWTVDGINRGNLQSTLGTPLNFQGFNYLVGGQSFNNFDIKAGGGLQNVNTNAPGLILGGASNGSSSNPNWNHLTIDLAGSGTTFGTLDFIGNAGVENTITINNATSALYDVSYTPAVNVIDANNATNNSTYQQLNFTYTDGSVINNTGFALNYTALSAASASTDFVNIQQPLNTVTVNQAGSSAGNILLSSGPSNNSSQTGNYFSFGANIPVYYNNATNLSAIAANANNTITLGDFALSGTLSLQNGAITQSGASPLSVGTLVLQNVGTASATPTILTTAVGNLDLEQAGPFTINQTGALTLTGMNMSRDVTINSDSNITGTVALNSSGLLNIDAGTNNIALSGANTLSGPISLTGGSVALNNTINTLLGAVTATDLTVTSTGNITQNANIIANNAAFTAGSDISLTSGGNDFDTIQVNGGNSVSIVDLDGIGLRTLTATNVSINAGGAITDANNGGTNIIASSVTLRAVDGIGGGGVNYSDANGYLNIDRAGAIHTSTSNLDIINTDTVNSVGTVNISNQGTVQVNNLKNNGDIIFEETSGNINLNGASPGAISANNNDPNNKNTVFAGSVAIFGNGANGIYTDGLDKSVFDITAQNLLVQNFNDFGTKAYPIRLLVRNQATLIANTGGYTFPLGNPPDLVTKGDLVSIQGINVLSGQQLIDIESLGDVDPAIFTKVRNYNHEDVAILMPEDQRLDGDNECASDDKKKCKKQQSLN